MTKKKKETTKMITCNKCGWVAFQVSRKSAEAEVKRFNEYYDTLSKKEQKDYYGGKKSTIDFYERCMLCGGSYTNFRNAVKGDCPDGVTINPIIERND